MSFLLPWSRMLSSLPQLSIWLRDCKVKLRPCLWPAETPEGPQVSFCWPLKIRHICLVTLDAQLQFILYVPLYLCSSKQPSPQAGLEHFICCTCPRKAWLLCVLHWCFKKNQNEFQFGKREGKVDTKKVNGGKHLIDQSGSGRQNVLWLSEILEFGEHPQRGFRVCVLEQEMGQRYMDTSRNRVSYETVHIPGRGNGMKQRRGLWNLKCSHSYNGPGFFVAEW